MTPRKLIRMLREIRKRKYPRSPSVRLSKLTEGQLFRYNAAKEFVKLLGKECTEVLNQKITYRLHRVNHKLGLFSYTEVEDGEDFGRIVVKVTDAGKAYIDSKYVLPHAMKRALRNFQLPERIKTTKSENRWKGSHS
jgi:hypothetical protein